MRKEFMYAFCISRTIVFEVNYYTLGGNEHPYFSTSASKFNRPKTDWKRCGQAQADLLPKFSTAMKFWKKWDKHHCKDLTDDEYTELIKDIDELKTKYPYHIEDNLDVSRQPYNPYIGFWRIKNMSMTVPKSR